MSGLTFTLERLQGAGIGGAQPGGEAPEDPQQVTGGVAEHHVGVGVAGRAEHAEAVRCVSKRVLAEQRRARTANGRQGQTV